LIGSDAAQRKMLEHSVDTLKFDLITH